MLRTPVKRGDPVRVLTRGHAPGQPRPSENDRAPATFHEKIRRPLGPLTQEQAMPSRTSLATRSVLLLVAAALTAAAVRGARPAPAGAGLLARYGAPVTLGNGQARTYVMVDARGQPRCSG